MKTAAWWLETRARFDKLRTLDGENIAVRGTELSGGSTKARAQFQRLATGAGRAATGTDAAGGYNAWLTCLREELQPMTRAYFRVIDSVSKNGESDEDRAGPPSVIESVLSQREEKCEVILHVCQASMELCDLLESKAFAEVEPTDADTGPTPAHGNSELHDVAAVAAVSAERAEKWLSTDLALPEADSWQSVTIRFTSEFQVQITIGGRDRGPKTYEDLGFANGTTKNPNFAWKALQELARRGGTIDSPPGRPWGKNWSAVEKRMQEVRATLRRYFKADADPVPFVRGEGYKTAFRIDPGSDLD